MDPRNTATASPSKRKRNPNVTPTKPLPRLLYTDMPHYSLIAEEGACGSPRTEMAYQFQELELESSPIKKLELRGSSLVGVVVTDKGTTAKRIKFIEQEGLEIPETPQSAFSGGAGEEAVTRFEGTVQVNNHPSPVIFRGLGPHSTTQPAASRSRPRKRVGTPPSSGSRDNSPTHPEDISIDFDRAALTWHDDEITGHEVDDPEDDGEGINGVGFKPTPAEAHARVQRRRQQMAEYKTRELKEARAWRIERRRGGASVSRNSSKEVAARKVRFSEAEVNNITTS